VSHHNEGLTYPKPSPKTTSDFNKKNIQQQKTKSQQLLNKTVTHKTQSKHNHIWYSQKNSLKRIKHRFLQYQRDTKSGHYSTDFQVRKQKRSPHKIEASYNHSTQGNQAREKVLTDSGPTMGKRFQPPQKKNSATTHLL